MPQTIQWIIPQTVLSVKIEGDLTKQEIMSLDTLVYDALVSAPACETMIFDIRTVWSVPSHLYQMRLKRTIPPDHPLSSICIIGEYRLLRLMLLLTYSATRAGIQLFPNTASPETCVKRGSLSEAKAV